MWEPETTVEYERDHKYYAKKHPDELAAVLNNLGRYRDLLHMVKHPNLINVGFVHPEQIGIVGLDQTGTKRKVAGTRLYIWPDPDSKIIYLLGIKEKNKKTRQSKDIEEMKKLVILFQNKPDPDLAD